MKVMKSSKTKKIVLWKELELADNPIAQIKGIMFRKKIYKPMLFIFSNEQPVSIHSFFCVPFDIIYMDRFGKVTDILHQVQPGNVLPKIKCKYILECKSGDARKKKIKKGDKLIF
jgi:uncharacterized membrane protein (UPF0127 family)